MLSFPPHCSHELQPLDRTVFDPFKTFYNQGVDNWMRQKENAGKSMTIGVIPSIVSYAFPKAMTPANIISGFRATGICPFDRNVFPPEKFLSTYSTDRPMVEATQEKMTPSDISDRPMQSTSRESDISLQSTPSQNQNVDKFLQVLKKFGHLVEGNQEKMDPVKGKRESHKFLLTPQLKWQ